MMDFHDYWTFRLVVMLIVATGVVAVRIIKELEKGRR